MQSKYHCTPLYVGGNGMHNAGLTDQLVVSKIPVFFLQVLEIQVVIESVLLPKSAEGNYGFAFYFNWQHLVNTINIGFIHSHLEWMYFGFHPYTVFYQILNFFINLLM